MKTTEMSLNNKSRRSLREFMISILDMVVIRALLILFFIFIVVFFAKSQPLAGCTGKGSTLTVMSSTSMRADTPAANPEALTHMLGYGRSATKRRINSNENDAGTMVSSYFTGVYDADRFYRSKKSGTGLVFASTLLGSPVLGLIPATVCSGQPPKVDNLNIPPGKPVGNIQYLSGYKRESNYWRRRNTWAAFVAASVIWVCVAVFLLY